MSKINSKISPQDYEDDDKLYKSQLMLSWIKPEHFLKGKKVKRRKTKIAIILICLEIILWKG